jgi:hypothetical protein
MSSLILTSPLEGEDLRKATQVMALTLMELLS